MISAGCQWNSRHVLSYKLIFILTSECIYKCYQHICINPMLVIYITMYLYVSPLLLPAATILWMYIGIKFIRWWIQYTKASFLRNSCFWTKHSNQCYFCNLEFITVFVSWKPYFFGLVRHCSISIAERRWGKRFYQNIFFSIISNLFMNTFIISVESFSVLLCCCLSVKFNIFNWYNIIYWHWISSYSEFDILSDFNILNH